MDGSTAWMHPITKEQIRLLDILPGNEDEPIECDIYTATFSDHLAYEEISYTSPANLTTIHVSNRPAKVTKNLHAAVRRMRCQHEMRTLWIDQLCIRQHDEAEKSEQVPLMRTIYSQCTKALIWLGEIREDVPSSGVESVIEYFTSLQDSYNPVLPELTQS